MVPIFDVPLVVTAWCDLGISRSGLPCLVRVVGAMETGGARGACVPDQHVPTPCVTLVTIVEYLVFIGRSQFFPHSASHCW